MRYEDNFLKSFDYKNLGEHPLITEMHKKIMEMRTEDAVNPYDFVNPDSRENIDKDMEHVAERKKRFDVDPSKQTADVFEYIVYHQIELSNWLGQNAETVRTSEYDDIINGIDLIVEFSDEYSSKHLALAIDVTFGTQSIAKKFQRMKDEILRDNLAEIKYFKSHNFKGTLKQLPRIVIGVEKDTVLELAGLLKNGKKKELGTHFAKDIIVEEIKLQMKSLLAYAKKHQKYNATKSYTQALRTLETQTINPNVTDQNHSQAIRDDRVFSAIREQLKEKFSD